MTGSFVIKKNRILEILFFIIIFLVNLKMTLNISDFATANLSILIIGIFNFLYFHCFVWKHLKCCLCHCWYQYLGIFILIKWLNILFV